MAKIGENISIGHLVVERSEDPGDYLQEYMHGNRVGVLVCLTVGKPETLHNARFHERRRTWRCRSPQACRSAVRAVDRDGVDPAEVEHEKRILIEQAKAEGKTAGDRRENGRRAG